MPPKKKISQVETASQVDWAPKLDDTREQATDLRAKLVAIKEEDGVVGYILRGETSASVDINDPSKIIDYAVLSASVFDAAESLSDAYGLGRICNVVTAGGKLKVLLLTIDDQKVSVFMEKTVDHEAICKQLC